MQNREIHIKGLSEEAPLTAEGLDVQLKIAQGDNLRLKAELSEVKEKAEEAAVISIMNLLNSAQVRFTLDRILTTTSLLATIRNEGNTEFKPNGTLALLNICKNLLMALNQLGVSPTGFKRIGEEFDLTDEIINEYELIGEGFDPGEIRKVKIIGPAWEYKGKVISLPRIQKV